ncbi:hypothetical protein LGN00_37250, partial [Burkholderia cepacia]|nr:hypothetical protein [Burkholderia cepacia]
MLIAGRNITASGEMVMRMRWRNRQAPEQACFGAPGWDRTSNPCLRSFTGAQHILLNQSLTQLANSKTKATQG